VLGGEKTSREFIILSMVVQTLTALVLPATGLICAVTIGIVVFHLAFHRFPPLF